MGSQTEFAWAVKCFSFDLFRQPGVRLRSSPNLTRPAEGKKQKAKSDVGSGFVVAAAARCTLQRTGCHPCPLQVPGDLPHLLFLSKFHMFFPYLPSWNVSVDMQDTQR